MRRDVNAGTLADYFITSGCLNNISYIAIGDKKTILQRSGTLLVMLLPLETQGCAKGRKCWDPCW